MLGKRLHSSSPSDIKEKVAVKSELFRLGYLGLFEDFKEFMLEEFS
jgi:hypothetical protein